MEIEGKIPPARAIHILRQVAAGLEDAHAAGLVHRDIKPLNVMLTRSMVQGDIVKVLDFGLVKDVDDAGRNASLPQRTSSAGTAFHRARTPQKSASGRSTLDLYSLGGVAYFLLSGSWSSTATASADLLQGHA